MTRSGIQFPDIIDLTTKASDVNIRLVLAETEALTGDHIPALKRKLDNYVAYAQSGKHRPVVIRVDLYAQPHPVDCDIPATLPDSFGKAGLGPRG